LSKKDRGQKQNPHLRFEKCGFFGGGLGLNSVFCNCKAGALLLEPYLHQDLPQLASSGGPLRQHKKKKSDISWARWLTSVIPATQEAELRKIWFKAILGKKLAKPHLN
jgi:hypothetical protein